MTKPHYYRDLVGHWWDGKSVPKDLKENIAFRKDLLWRGANEKGAAEAIIEKCRQDILFYVNSFVFTYDPRRKDSTRIPFITYQFQDEAILQLKEAIDNGHDVGIKKSRDMGASWVNLVVLEWFWHFSRGMESFLVVSRNEDYVDAPGDSKSLFWKIDFILDNEPAWLKPAVKRTSMHIGNELTGSVIDGESTTGDVARGDRRKAILLDEYAAFDTAAGYKANSSTMAATDCRIFNSTPRGSANAFYDLMHNAGTAIITMHWSQHPQKSRGLYTIDSHGKLSLLDDWTGEVEVREKGTGKVRKVQYPGEYPFVRDGKKRSPWYDLQCSRATSSAEIGQELDIDFLGSDYQFFDAAAIEAYKSSWCVEPYQIGELDYDKVDGHPIRFRKQLHGSLALWITPDEDFAFDHGRKFVIGADVSAGTGASNSTFSVYEVGSNDKVAEYANSKIEPRDFAVCVMAAARWFNNAMVVPDRSGPTGEQFVKRFTQDGDHPPLYRRYKDKKISKDRVDEYGVFLNVATKSGLMIEYRDAIGSARIINRSELAMNECLQFVRSPKGEIEHSAALNSQDPSGARTAHGDRVISDALATMVLGESDAFSLAPKDDVPYNTLKWRMNQRAKAEATASREGLGEGW